MQVNAGDTQKINSIYSINISKITLYTVSTVFFGFFVESFELVASLLLCGLFLSAVLP